jgi:hypothetical protein
MARCRKDEIFHLFPINLGKTRQYFEDNPGVLKTAGLIHSSFCIALASLPLSMETFENH